MFIVRDRSIHCVPLTDRKLMRWSAAAGASQLIGLENEIKLPSPSNRGKDRADNPPYLSVRVKLAQTMSRRAYGREESSFCPYVSPHAGWNFQISRYVLLAFLTSENLP
jgi:hypothetical protein